MFTLFKYVKIDNINKQRRGHTGNKSPICSFAKIVRNDIKYLVKQQPIS